MAERGIEDGAQSSDTSIDVLGIGFGPANIALAIALEELWPEATARFLEAGDGPAWQPGMLLPQADIQHNPLRDLVTPRNPRSRYTFVNYLHEHGRLFDHLNLNVRFPLRKEYAGYISWAAAAFADHVDYGQRVVSVDYLPGDAGTYRVETDVGKTYAARALVVATGRPPLIPPIFQSRPSERVFHSTRYLSDIDRWRRTRLERVAVLGASQTAAEVSLDLRSRCPDTSVVNIMRGFGYRLKDTSPFSEEVYFPEFVDYFYRAPQASKDDLRHQLHHTNYSSVDGDVLDQLYKLMYEDRLDGEERLTIRPHREVVDVALGDDRVVLTLRERHTDDIERVTVDAVVLATGFRNIGAGIDDERYPSVLQPLLPFLDLDERGGVKVEQRYRLLPARGPAQASAVYLNGLCESSHGMGDAGSFSLLAVRTGIIANSLLQLRSRPPPAASGCCVSGPRGQSRQHTLEHSPVGSADQ